MNEVHNKVTEIRKRHLEEMKKRRDLLSSRIAELEKLVQEPPLEINLDSVLKEVRIWRSHK